MTISFKNNPEETCFINFVMNRNASPGKGSVCDVPAWIGAVTYSADGADEKQRVARRLKFLIKEQALRTRAVD